MLQSKWFIASFSIVCFLLAIPLFMPTPAIAAGADPDPATVPASIDPLPAGWKAGEFDSGDLKTGRNTQLEAHFELHSTPSRGANDKQFADWAKRAKEREAKDSPLANRKETDLKASKIGGHDLFEYEITGDLYGTPLHYRTFFVPIRGLFCTLNCWTTPEHWESAKPDFEKLVTNLK